MAIPSYASSVITSLSTAQQGLANQSILMGGRNTSDYKIMKKGTSYAFNLWRSPVYIIGKPFDIIEITINVHPAIASNMSFIPVIYFDNESSSSIGTTVNSTNYSSSQKSITLSPPNFASGIRGRKDFVLELQFTGSALVTVKMPIEIEVEVYEHL